MTTITRIARHLYQVWLNCKHMPPMFSQYEDLAPRVGDEMYCTKCHGTSEIVSVVQL